MRITSRPGCSRCSNCLSSPRPMPYTPLLEPPSHDVNSIATIRGVPERGRGASGGRRQQNSARHSPTTPGSSRARRGALWVDIDGNSLSDYYLASSMIIGPIRGGARRRRSQSSTRACSTPAQTAISRGGQVVCTLVACAERVRCVSSGTEEVQAAAPASPRRDGRNKADQVRGHDHGWMDKSLEHPSIAGGLATGPTRPHRVAGSARPGRGCGRQYHILAERLDAWWRAGAPATSPRYHGNGDGSNTRRDSPARPDIRGRRRAACTRTGTDS